MLRPVLGSYDPNFHAYTEVSSFEFLLDLPSYDDLEQLEVVCLQWYTRLVGGDWERLLTTFPSRVSSKEEEAARLEELLSFVPSLAHEMVNHGNLTTVSNLLYRIALTCHHLLHG